MSQTEQDAARAELKIRKISNGWLLKSRDGWNAFNGVPALLAAIEAALMQEPAEEDAQPRFFHKDWPGPRK